MISHAEIARTVASAYSVAPTVYALDNVQGVYRAVRAGTAIDEFVVAVPGTTDVQGWLRDFRWWPAMFHPLGWCHRGFGLGGKALWADVRRAVIDIKCPTTYCGHSLGGALAATLAAYHSADPQVTAPCRLVTFGAPRVPLSINLAFSALLRHAAELVAYERDGDPIPHVPPRPLFRRGMRGTEIGSAVFGDPMANHAIDLYVADLTRLGL